MYPSDLLTIIQINIYNKPLPRRVTVTLLLTKLSMEPLDFGMILRVGYDNPYYRAVFLSLSQPY